MRVLQNFLSNQNREFLRDLLKSNVGEIDSLDFKEIWPEKTKLAKHVLAFSNSGGGILVIGIAETDGVLSSVGLEELQDKADINKKINKYFPNGVKYEILDFSYKESEYSALVGKSFQVMLIEYDHKKIPFISIKAGDGLKENTVYIRRGTNSTEANHDELQKLINERIQTGFDSSNILKLEEHLEQLKTLYSYIKKIKNIGISFGLSSSTMKAFNSMFSQEINSYYPDETYDEFIADLIKKKKKKILSILELD